MEYISVESSVSQGDLFLKRVFSSLSILLLQKRNKYFDIKSESQRKTELKWWLVDLPDKVNRQVVSRVVAREIGLECYN